MANEKRLIDANAICSECLARHSYNCTLCKIGTAPTVDAVEVVRCKDCKHREDGVCTLESVYDYPWYYTNDDDFCSHGERRTDNEVT